MKKSIPFLMILCLCKCALAQDSTKVSFSTEPDTLTKQRFIDRYENVFMTKVPTRHMFKMDVVLNPGVNADFEHAEFSNLTYHLGYEYKLRPALSLGLSGSSALYYASSIGWGGSFTADIAGRWYFDMKRRIKEGKSANNFSGNYLSVVYGRQWESSGVLPGTKIGVEFGMQRRFLNYGRIDFGIGLFYKDYIQKYFGGYQPMENRISEYAITTRANLGFAFGDWKRTSNLPVCEMLRCDAHLSAQWKFAWPVLNLGTRSQRATLSLAYERKLGAAPLSLNVQVFADYYHRFSTHVVNFENWYEIAYQIQPSLQMRYYFLQKRKIKRGSGGNNLSGLYLGPYADYIRKSSKAGSLKDSNKHLGLGFIVGYQKTLFRNAYIDFYGEESWNLLRADPGSRRRIGSFRAGFGLSF